jgi:hypothetical protein
MCIGIQFLGQLLVPTCRLVQEGSAHKCCQLVYFCLACAMFDIKSSFYMQKD